MANETKRLTPEAEREIAGRVNPQYSDTPGTESNERALLLSEVQHLRQERNTARGAVKELEAKVFSQGQALDVLRTCVARHQRDEANPPGYLQDAVIRAAGIGALHTERDMYRKACDKLRTRLAEIESQAPVAPAKGEPVRLTDVEMRQLAEATLYIGSIYDRVRAIEAAVWSANGLEAAR